MIILLGKQLKPFCGLTYPWTVSSKGFWRGRQDQVPQDF